MSIKISSDQFTLPNGQLAYGTSYGKFVPVGITYTGKDLSIFFENNQISCTEEIVDNGNDTFTVKMRDPKKSLAVEVPGQEHVIHELTVGLLNMTKSSGPEIDPYLAGMPYERLLEIGTPAADNFTPEMKETMTNIRAKLEQTKFNLNGTEINGMQWLAMTSGVGPLPALTPPSKPTDPHIIPKNLLVIMTNNGGYIGNLSSLVGVDFNNLIPEQREMLNSQMVKMDGKMVSGTEWLATALGCPILQNIAAPIAPAPASAIDRASFTISTGANASYIPSGTYSLEQIQQYIKYYGSNSAAIDKINIKDNGNGRYIVTQK